MADPQKDEQEKRDDPPPTPPPCPRHGAAHRPSECRDNWKFTGVK